MLLSQYVFSTNEVAIFIQGVNEMKFKLETNAATAKIPVQQLENLFGMYLWYLHS